MCFEVRYDTLPLARGVVDCLVLAYAFPAEPLAAMLPSTWQPATFGPWGFVVATFATARVPFPEWPGRDNFYVEYGIISSSSELQRSDQSSLYLIRSETNTRLVERCGHLLTHYRLRAPSILKEVDQGVFSLFISGTPGHADVRIEVDLSTPCPILPASSPFATFSQACQFFDLWPGVAVDNERVTTGLSYLSKHSQPVFVLNQQVQFVEEGPFGSDGRLAGAFYLANVERRGEAGCQIPRPVYN